MRETCETDIDHIVFIRPLEKFTLENPSRSIMKIDTPVSNVQQ